MPRIYLDQRGAGGYERPQRGGVRAGEVVGPDEREGGVASGEAGPREAAAEAASGAHHQDPAPRPRRVLRHRRPAPRLATAGKVTGAWTGWGDCSLACDQAIHDQIRSRTVGSTPLADRTAWSEV